MMMVLYRRWHLEFAPLRANIFSRDKVLTTMHEMGVSARIYFSAGCKHKHQIIASALLTE